MTTKKYHCNNSNEKIMILEAAILNVKSGMEQDFETTFKLASTLISQGNGYVSHELHRCMEVPGKYLLLVKWKTIEDHTIGFRQSPEYQQWKQLLHHFYEPFPTVEHFEEVFTCFHHADDSHLPDDEPDEILWDFLNPSAPIY
jgi:heme-degrading monooxygenase HmoA